MPEKVFVTGNDECKHPLDKEVKRKTEYDELVTEKIQVRFDEGDGIQRCGNCGKVWKEL